MKLYSNENIREGCMTPIAWLWFGSVTPFRSGAPIGTVFMLRLPWWTRQTVYDHSDGEMKEATCQLAFVMQHFKGPETYRWLWMPEREDRP